MKYLKYFESVADKNHGLLIETNERFWIGSVNMLDGYIEEVHTYEEAERMDFHHSFYFSIPQCEKIREEECMLFWVDEDGIKGEWTRGSVPRNIIQKIKNQIKII